MRSNLFKIYNYSPEMDFINFAKRSHMNLLSIEKSEHIKSYSLHHYGNDFDIEKLTETLKKEIDNYYNED